MIRFVPFSELQAWHLKKIAESLLVAPEAVRHSERDFVQRLAGGELQLYEYDEGIVVLHKEGSRLVLDAIACSKLGEAWKLVDDLRRLAAEWVCDTIFTTAFDKRLMTGIVKLGGSVESYDMVLTVGKPDEQ